ncbi:SWIM zinc finger family protein [Acidiferrobacter sp.]|uniref:SWIM zinc finger family protein n=1 Tax=Acidiferrobacter sp. TaxID=1872107 RepID=UPI003420F812
MSTCFPGDGVLARLGGASTQRSCACKKGEHQKNPCTHSLRSLRTASRRSWPTATRCRVLIRARLPWL